VKRHLRRAALAVFARVNPGDITIRHHYTGSPMRLHSFRHKGYWFHGARREAAEMRAFSRLLRPGDCVLEVGGHIGYLSVYLASLVGPRGDVHVFEPGTNNLPYLHANADTWANIHVVEEAVADRPGVLALYEEDLSGQNNSLLPDYGVLASNERYAVRARVMPRNVVVTTLDSYVERTGVIPNFIKIDIEGYEWEALTGARELLHRYRPALMVEVQRHREGIERLLYDAGYQVYAADARVLTRIPEATTNVFCLPTR
jgi:FkbM family methyltransferase